MWVTHKLLAMLLLTGPMKRNLVSVALGWQKWAIRLSKELEWVIEVSWWKQAIHNLANVDFGYLRKVQITKMLFFGE